MPPHPFTRLLLLSAVFLTGAGPLNSCTSVYRSLFGDGSEETVPLDEAPDDSDEVISDEDDVAPPAEQPFVVTASGDRVVYTGPLQAKQNGQLEATFEVTLANGNPATGELFATLGEPPTDALATHAHGLLEDGKIKLTLDVNWKFDETPETSLYIFREVEAQRVATIAILMPCGGTCQARPKTAF